MVAESVLKRGIQPHHYFIARTIMSFCEEGILKYAIVRSAMYRVGKGLREAYGGPSDPVKAIEFLNGLLGFTGRLEVIREGAVVKVTVDRATCKMCPRIIGGTELTEPLCPLPGLLSGYLGANLKGSSFQRDWQTCVINLNLESLQNSAEA
ncbi:hypothetical protein [Infirmifilum sp. NZ]|uniref:hypothetical protein n=1 Tax=Infirmifilum sp. NZ TaxID=2926850 RepID=UPI0027A9BBF1|nr:hypothetical protein [Infirmifilum sp. NZ]UNQ74028.1 hypothetical protein MOV14_03170 [Infirmifilum sp. NZ]